MPWGNRSPRRQHPNPQVPNVLVSCCWVTKQPGSRGTCFGLQVCALALGNAHVFIPVQAAGEVSSWGSAFPGAGRGVRVEAQLCKHIFSPLGPSESHDQAQRKGMGSDNARFVEELHGFVAKDTCYRER